MVAVLHIENLGKCYPLNRSEAAGAFGYHTLREELAGAFRSPVRWLRERLRFSRTDDFWALRDVNLEVHEGEVIGIIGRNGAGKSTLLKILSRITKPTRGRVVLRGRVGSLLEVGTGFHPELTGRENIYLNGAILGMSRHEIRRKFDEIVQFSEIEDFLETPVKRYSSGMYVRLAFAVAAHLEPEILIIDEVLAVGDLAFQRKCMGRMREVGRSGSTVLFVSHNMAAVESLCTRAILLEGGRISDEGPVPEVVRSYHRRIMTPRPGAVGSFFVDGSPGAGKRVLRSITLLDEDGMPTNHVRASGQFQVRIRLTAGQPVDFPVIGIGIDDNMGQRLLTLHTPLSTAAIERIAGDCDVACRVEQFPLAPGEYWLKVALSAAGREIDSVEQALPFIVTDGELFGSGRGFTRGLCIAPSKWETVTREAASQWETAK
jgi:lipopolysaccharide transport system ATP-binding protein